MGACKVIIEALRIVGRIVRRSREAMVGGDDSRLPREITVGNGLAQAKSFDFGPHHGQDLADL